jgi:cytosine/adenosine deaminase-related metal-dependent hydrolase
MILRRILLSSLALGAAASACAVPVTPSGPDADADADGPDADVDAPDADVDAPDGDVERDADVDVDADADGGDDAIVVRVGTAGLLLRGVVLRPEGVLDPGEVLVVGTTIRCVAADCSGEQGADEATIIDTRGTISAGLVDSHNHVAYDFLPEWVPNPPRTFSNRYDWLDDPSYEEHVRPYAAHRSENTHFCPAAKWGELRALVHGVTTMQSQPSASGSCIHWGIRNADGYHDLGYDHMSQDIGSVLDITDDDAASLVARFTTTDEPVTRYHVHMAEGVSGDALEEFDSFAGRDPRSNRHQGVSLLDFGTAILIHSVPLTAAQLDEVEETGAMIVWSPSSNVVLYGRTAPIGEILRRDIGVGLGPDWTPSGEDEILSELRYALDYGRDEGVEELTPQRLWEMATWEGADVVGLGDHIGQLAPGFRADIAVFARHDADPYLSVVESRAADVRLVLIDGQGFYGDRNLRDVTARNVYCEDFDGCGVEKYLCAQDSPTADTRRNETVEDIHEQLYNILEGIGYPPEEQYGRGDELLELVDCSL